MAALRYLLIALVLIALAVLGWRQLGIGHGSGGGGLERVTIGGRTFALEVAADADSRERGLMGRSEIADDGGMLFIFPDAARRSFWMGHCEVDIDVMFLNEAGRVLAIHEMTAESPQQPDESDLAYRDRMPGYESGGLAQFAIELRGGTIAQLGIETGDRIDLDFRRLKRVAR
jgi:uncharacterized membrane protein (UPF0127 family)